MKLFPGNSQAEDQFKSVGSMENQRILDKMKFELYNRKWQKSLLKIWKKLKSQNYVWGNGEKQDIMKFDKAMIHEKDTIKELQRKEDELEQYTRMDW